MKEGGDYGPDEWLNLSFIKNIPSKKLGKEENPDPEIEVLR